MQFPPDVRSEVCIMFSAHSLPVKVHGVHGGAWCIVCIVVRGGWYTWWCMVVHGVHVVCACGA